MINYGTINYTQNTATGNDQSETTKVYVVKSAYGNNIDIMTRADAKEMEKWDNAEILGYYTIIHPWLLAGTWEEINSKFCRMALNHMNEAGLLTQNDCGCYFMK